MLNLKYLLTIYVLVDFRLIASVPVEEPKVDQPANFNLEYEKYLQEVVKTLESDPAFKKKLENASIDDIKSGKIAKDVDLLHHDVRGQLNELKRLEMERLQEYVREQQALRDDPSFGSRRWRTRHNDGLDELFRKFAHLDHNNPDTFESHDLEKLIRVALGELEKQDKLEKEQFKRYEMEKQRVYEERLANMTEEEKKKEAKKHEEMLEKRKDHKKIHEPGTKEQFEEVWEKQDNMPKDDFDPRIFFMTHDTNSDGFWDENEMKALLKQEVDKAFEGRSVDEYERQHELEEMRRVLEDHIDIDKNRMISVQEFMEWTKKNAYQQDKEWKTAEEKDIYSKDEYQRYVDKRKNEGEHHGDDDDLNYYPYNPEIDPNFYPEYHPPPTPVYYNAPGPNGPGNYPPGGPQPNVYQFPSPPSGQYHPNQGQPNMQYNHPQAQGLPPSPSQQYNQPPQMNPGNHPQYNQPPQNQPYNQQVPPNQPHYNQQMPPNQPQYNQQPPPNQPQYNQQAPPNQPQHNQQLPPNQPQYNQQPPQNQPQYNQQPPPQPGHYNPNQPNPNYNQPPQHQQPPPPPPPAPQQQPPQPSAVPVANQPRSDQPHH